MFGLCSQAREVQVSTRGQSLVETASRRELEMTVGGIKPSDKMVVQLVLAAGGAGMVAGGAMTATAGHFHSFVNFYHHGVIAGRSMVEKIDADPPKPKKR
jgi:hypothetical protein